MYVGVHKKRNQWFRNDNGKLVGTEIPQNTSYYKELEKHIGKQIVIKNKNNKVQIIYYGKFVNNKFVRVNSPKKSNKTCSYYVFVLN